MITFAIMVCFIPNFVIYGWILMFNPITNTQVIPNFHEQPRNGGRYLTSNQKNVLYKKIRFEKTRHLTPQTL